MNRVYTIARGVWLLALLLLLSNGSKASAEGCFIVAQESITCGTPEGTTGYALVLGILNQYDMTVAVVDYTVLSPGNIVISPGSRTIDPPAPVSDTIRTTLTISGSGATGGTTLRILVRIANGTSRTSISCSDTVTITLPNCSTDCLSFIGDSLRCNEGPRGTNYIYSFGIVNEGGLAIPGAELRYSVISPGTVSISPTYVELSNGLIAGDSLKNLSFTIDGVGATPGRVVTVQVQLCNDGICCDDTVTLALPSCRPEGCLGLEEQGISCGGVNSHYTYSFTYKNLSNFLGTMLELKSDQVEFVNGRIALTELDMDDKTSQSIEMIVPADLQGKVITYTATLSNEDGDSCTTTFEVKTPVCSWECFTLRDETIQCLPPVNGNDVFAFSSLFYNESGYSVRWIKATSLTPGVLAETGWFDLGKEVASGESLQIGPLPITGAAGGQSISVQLSLAGASSTDVICTDTIELTLPDCKPEFTGCFDFLEEEVVCNTTPTAPRSLNWSFRLSNTSNRNLDSLTITSIQSSNGQGVAVTPATIYFAQPIPPGEVRLATLTVSGPGVVKNEVLLMETIGFFEDENRCPLTHELDVECGVVGESCFTANEVKTETFPSSPDRVDWTLRITNSSGTAINGLLMTTLTSNVQVANSPYTLESPLLPDSSTIVTISLLNGTPGQTVEVVIGTTWQSPTNVICADTVEMVIPERTNSVADRGVRREIALYNVFPNPASEKCTVRFSTLSSARNR